MKIRLLHDKEFASVTENTVKETLTKNVSFPFRNSSQQEANILVNLSQAVAARYSLESASADRLMVASVTRNPQSNSKLSRSYLYSQAQFPDVIKKFSFPNFHKC